MNDHACWDCNDTFWNYDDLRRHQARRHGDEPFLASRPPLQEQHQLENEVGAALASIADSAARVAS